MNTTTKILQKIGLIRTPEPKSNVKISRRYLGASANGKRMSYRR